MTSLDRYQWLSSCTGVELHILQDGNVSCRLCEISLRKNALSIERKMEVEGSIADVLKKVPADKPVSLSITGKGIISKKTERAEEISEDRLLQLFPNIKPEQFYVQNFISGSLSFVSIVRRELVEELLQAFSKLELNVLLLSTGPFAASHILKQVNFYGSQLQFDGHDITLSDAGHWDEYRYVPSAKSEFPLKIDIEPIAEQFLLAYAAAFQLALYPRLEPVVLPVDIVQRNIEDFGQKQKFDFRLAALLGVFFVLLLVNFILFSFYNQKNEVLLAALSQTSASAESLQDIERDIAVKEKLLTQLGWYKGIRHSWLADQLGQSLPDGIQLREIAINPLNTTESNRQRKEVYKAGIIEVSGEAGSLEPLNHWITELRSREWSGQVNLDRFSPSSENENQSFNITITF